MLTPASTLRLFPLADGYRAAVRTWERPDAAARLVFVHGIISHGGWYLETGRTLAAAGFDVHFLDRRGSGLNIAARGDVDRWTTWPADVQRYLESLEPGVPTVLLGISWGGKLAASVAARRPDLLAGVGFLCPGIFARQQPGPLRRAAILAAARLPARKRRVAVPLGDPTLFTDEPPWQRYVAEDPLTLRKITLRFAHEDLKFTQHAQAATQRLRIPALLLLAGRDRIVDNGRVRRWFGAGPADNRKIIEYPAAAHTLEFGPHAAEYLRDLTTWVRRTVVSSGSN